MAQTIRNLLAASTIWVAGLCLPAVAEPALRKPQAPVAVPTWSGAYIGAHAGAFRGTTMVVDTLGPAVFGDNVDTAGSLVGLQLGYNWRLGSRLVGGVEVDVSHMDGDGAFTCLQRSATVFGSDCKVEPRALATLTARLGTLIDRDERTLLYGKAGLAWMRSHVAMHPSNMTLVGRTLTGDPLVQADPVLYSGNARGWMIGAGVEYALDPAWSMKLEYGYHRFDKVSVATPENADVDAAGVVTALPAGTAHVSHDMHVVKLGLNHSLHGNADSSRAFAPPSRSVAVAGDWRTEFGLRYWYSSGRSRNDNSNGQIPILSRLTYDKLTGHSGEVFGRIDTPHNVFVKGFIGLGSITKGRHNDEDWGLAFETLPLPYETTESSVTGGLKYGTIDMGVTVMRSADYKVGVFGGYNYFHSTMDAYGCNQIVNPLSVICTTPVPSTDNVVSQEDTWHSFRLGVNAEARLWDRFSVNADIAYVPYLFYRGLDSHWLRGLFFPSSGTGRGVQAEIILNYHLTEALSLGVGGRYWSMWTGTNAEHTCNTCGGVSYPYKNSTERYGVFLQMAYRK